MNCNKYLNKIWIDIVERQLLRLTALSEGFLNLFEFSQKMVGDSESFAILEIPKRLFQYFSVAFLT